MDQVNKLENDLDEARAELHQTLQQINQKVDSQLIRPKNLLRAKPLISMGIAAVVGFAIGMGRDRAVTVGIFGAGLLLGFGMLHGPSQRNHDG